METSEHEKMFPEGKLKFMEVGRRESFLLLLVVTHFLRSPLPLFNLEVKILIFWELPSNQLIPGQYYNRLNGSKISTAMYTVFPEKNLIYPLLE
jgi:hypothetical protein